MDRLPSLRRHYPDQVDGSMTDSHPLSPLAASSPRLFCMNTIPTNTGRRQAGTGGANGLSNPYTLPVRSVMLPSMMHENIGRWPTFQISPYVDSIRAALRESFGWVRESTSQLTDQIRGRLGHDYPALEGFSRLHRGADAPKPLAAFVPAAYGGRGQETSECLTVLEELSYASLPLSLIAGINGALFLQPLSRYGSATLQGRVYRDVITNGALGGLMITEPDFGSDALNMQTSFTRENGTFHLQGTKHWGGLTGHADYWLITARERGDDGRLARNINFLLWERSDGGIDVEEYYRSLGLEEIPYGRNAIDTRIPESRRLTPLASGVRMLLDVLHRSRLQFPGMAMGFLRRILDEALAHARSRIVGGKPLSAYDQVQDRIAEIEAAYTTCSAMCAFTSREAPITRDCSPLALPANAVKAVVTDLMQSASQSLLQLVGAKGYRRDHYAGRATVDCRPFQIFEGSNDILYEQIADAVLKGMRRAGEQSVGLYLRTLEATARVADRVRDLFDFSLPENLPQRKRVDLGRAVGRVISMQMVTDLRDRGFDGSMAETAVALLRRSVARTIGGLGEPATVHIADDYHRGGHWRALV